jgi:hypothetical protein
MSKPGFVSQFSYIFFTDYFQFLTQQYFRKIMMLIFILRRNQMMQNDSRGTGLPI